MIRLVSLFLTVSVIAASGGSASAQEPSAPPFVYNGGRPAASPSGPSMPPAVPQHLLNSTEAAIDQQSKGEYPTMDRGPALPLGTLQRSWDRPVAASGQTAPGVIHYLWQSDFVMGVRTRDFMVTTLMLPGWEKVTEFYVGDPVVFEIRKVRANVIAVRSRNAGADSNLTLLGKSGNLYNFYLRSESWNSSQISDLAVYVDVTRQGDGAEQDSDRLDDDPPGPGQGLPDYVRRIIRRPEDIRFDMKLSSRQPGDAEIAPERVFEDGLFTYFDFGSRADTVSRPVVHQLVDGVDTVVNTRTIGPNGAVLVAEAVGDFTLRNGSKVVCAKRVPGG